MPETRERRVIGQVGQRRLGVVGDVELAADQQEAEQPGERHPEVEQAGGAGGADQRGRGRLGGVAVLVLVVVLVVVVMGPPLGALRRKTPIQCKVAQEASEQTTTGTGSGRGDTSGAEAAEPRARARGRDGRWPTAEGLAAVTMRRLAADVGVEAMSLYHHVPGKEGLLDGLAEAVLARSTPRSRPGSRPTTTGRRRCATAASPPAR